MNVPRLKWIREDPLAQSIIEGLNRVITETVGEAKLVLTPEELNSIFLGKYGYERTAWHIASENCQIELLQKLWEWAKKY